MIEHIPEEWIVEGGSHFYQLNLKMCQLKQLKYNFRWGTSRYAMILRKFPINSANGTGIYH